MAFFLGVVRALLVSLLVSAAVANGKKCENPKVRREWRKLSSSERSEWIDAVNCLNTIPHDPRMVPTVPTNISLIPPVNQSSSFYDDFVYIHMDLNWKIHFTGLFLPWHRYYLQYFEDSLIEKCGYKGVQPYWDWTEDAHDMYNSAFFDNSSSGVGGWGHPDTDFQITSGGFKDQVRAYPIPHYIRRNFSLYPFSNPAVLPPFGNDPNAPPSPTTVAINGSMTKQNVDSLIANYTGDYFGFQTYFESSGGAHIGAHLIMGGDMTGTCPKAAIGPNCVTGPKWTPNDPLFFLHHAFVDKIWNDWQRRDPRNMLAYGGGSITASTIFATFIKYPTGGPPYLGFDSEIPSDGLWNATIWDIMDIQGDTLCYTYE